MKEKIRIAAGQGFWGDLLEAPVRQVEGGPIDYLMLDYLAEVTMSIMQKQKARDPNAGYARDFVPLMRRILPACVERGIKVTANAGGVNVAGCATAVRDVARDLGLAGKIFFFSSRRRHTRSLCDWSSDVCSSDLGLVETKDTVILGTRGRGMLTITGNEVKEMASR